MYVDTTTGLCMQYQVRKIFTLRKPLQDTSPDSEDYPELELESHLRETEQADILKSNVFFLFLEGYPELELESFFSLRVT